MSAGIRSGVNWTRFPGPPAPRAGGSVRLGLGGPAGPPSRAARPTGRGVIVASTTLAPGPTTPLVFYLL